MRKHGWELPYHPLQVVAVSVFLALAFAFYVFFVPFVGSKFLQYSFSGLYSVLVTAAFGLYIWCAACDPVDPAVLDSKKYKKTPQIRRNASFDDSISRRGSINFGRIGVKLNADESFVNIPPVKESTDEIKGKNFIKSLASFLLVPCACFRFQHKTKTSLAQNEPSEQHSCDEDVLYCSLCEVEISKNSKHCRVCDKCVDGFDHHCRWLNNCIGRANYREFFALMIFALLLLILQWSLGIFVLVRCFLHRAQFDEEIVSKLGSSFSLGPFVVVLCCCTVLAMIASTPLGQLLFFHVLLVSKGISTYDYIIAMREQEHQTIGDGGQSPQRSSHASSLSAFSNSSSFNAFHVNHASWCTHSGMLMEDQFDVVPPEGSQPSVKAVSGRLTRKPTEQGVKKAKGSVKISPWALAQMNGEEVSRLAAQARKKSKVLRRITRQEGMIGLETDSSLESSSRDLSTEIKPVHDNPRNFCKNDKQQFCVKSAPLMRPTNLNKVSYQYTSQSYHVSNKNLTAMSNKLMQSSAPLDPLQLETRSTFRSSLSMSGGRVIPSSTKDSTAASEIQTSKASGSSLLDTSTVPITSLSIAEDAKSEKSTSDGYDGSEGASGDDTDQNSAKLHKPSQSKPPSKCTNLDNMAMKHVTYPSAEVPYSTTGKSIMTEKPSSSHQNLKERKRSQSLIDLNTELPGMEIFRVNESPQKHSSNVNDQQQ